MHIFFPHTDHTFIFDTFKTWLQELRIKCANVPKSLRRHQVKCSRTTVRFAKFRASAYAKFRLCIDTLKSLPRICMLYKRILTREFLSLSNGFPDETIEFLKSYFLVLLQNTAKVKTSPPRTAGKYMILMGKDGGQVRL